MRRRVQWTCAVVIAAGVLAAFALNRPATTRLISNDARQLHARDGLQVIVMQMRWNLDDYATAATFRRRIQTCLEAAMARTDPGCHVLVAFPEDIGAPLFFLDEIDTVRGARTHSSAMESLAESNSVSMLYNMHVRRLPPARALAWTRASAVGQAYIETFSQTARDFGVYIVAGSVPLPDFEWTRDGSHVRYAPQSTDVFNVAYFFGPDGRVLGRQKKIDLIPLERDGGLSLSEGRLEDLQVIPTPFGNVGIAVCADAFNETIVEALVQKGADIIVQPSANPEPWTPNEQETWLHSAWKVAQQHPQLRCVINPMMTGRLFELTFEGQSSVAVHASRVPESPGYTNTEAKGGFLRVATKPNDEEFLIVDVPEI